MTFGNIAVLLVQYHSLRMGAKCVIYTPRCGKI